MMMIRMIMIDDDDYLGTVRGPADVEDRPAGGLLGLGNRRPVLLDLPTSDVVVPAPSH